MSEKSETQHKEPLQKTVPVELSKVATKGYRENAEAVTTILGQKEALKERRKAHEVTERELAEAKRDLAKANIDPTTGLPNKNQFLSDLDAMVSRARHRGINLAMAQIDAIDFKYINDTFGHPTGDKALAHIGNKIKAAVRPSDRTYRTGGDEFTVLMLDFGDDPYLEAGEEIKELCEVTSNRIEDSVQEGVDDIGFPPEAKVRVSAAVGVLGITETGAEFYERIDAEMFARKRQQKLDAGGQSYR